MSTPPVWTVEVDPTAPPVTAEELDAAVAAWLLALVDAERKAEADTANK